MKKIFYALIVIAVIILAIILGMIYISPKFNPEWAGCQSDADCMLAPDYMECSCAPIAINKESNDTYSDFLKRTNMRMSIEWNIGNKWACSACLPLPQPQAICQNNHCSVNVSYVAGAVKPTA